jgi:DNA-binding transcriptional MerR regulator/methylmalonyl-CoA mutase cobalamin-binding subunit
MDDGVLPTKPETLSIAAVERDTGLSKDTLRVWERRYGFPAPGRDALGERSYPVDQVERLRIIKRLLDGGHRPGRVVTLPLDELDRLSARASSELRPPVEGAPPPDLQRCIDLLRSHEIEGLRRQLSQAQMRMGLGRFISDVLVPLNTAIGDAWMRGQLEIFEEHVYTEVQQIVLRSALATLPDPGLALPRVLLTTFPGEPHAQGLLLAEAIFAIDGARCISLGAQTPVWDIALAAKALKVDIVALGFSGCMNPNQVVDGLVELRRKVAPEVAIWVGGSAPVLSRRPVPGVKALGGLMSIHTALQAWHRGDR